MEITKEQTQVLVASEAMKFKKLQIADLEKLAMILTSGLYADPLVAVIREVLSNAWDSHKKALLQGRTPAEPIKVYVDRGTQQLVIADFGTGIRPEDVESVALALAGSDKDKDNSLIGGWGLGFKSPYALSSHWSFENRYDGHTYTYACALLDDDVTASLVSTQTSLTTPNGVTIRIPISDTEAPRALMLTRYYGQFLRAEDDRIGIQVDRVNLGVPHVNDTFTLKVDGFTVKVHKLKEKGDEQNPLSPSWDKKKVMYYNQYSRGESEGTIVTVGGVPYVVSAQGLEGLNSDFWKENYWLQAPVGFLTPIPSRDSIRTTEASRARLEALESAALGTITAAILQTMKDAKTPMVLSQALRSAQTDQGISKFIAHAVLDQIVTKIDHNKDSQKVPFGPRVLVQVAKTGLYNAKLPSAKHGYWIQNYDVKGHTVYTDGSAVHVELLKFFHEEIKTRTFNASSSRWGTNPPPLTPGSSYYTEMIHALVLNYVWDTNYGADRKRVLTPEYIVLDDMGRGASQRIAWGAGPFQTTQKELLFITDIGNGTTLSNDLIQRLRDYLLVQIGYPKDRVKLASELPDNVPAAKAPQARKRTNKADTSTPSNPDAHEVKGTQVIGFNYMAKRADHHGPVATTALHTDSPGTIWCHAYRNNADLYSGDQEKLISSSELVDRLEHIRNLFTDYGLNLDGVQWRKVSEAAYDSLTAKFPPALVFFQAGASNQDVALAKRNWTYLPDHLDVLVNTAKAFLEEKKVALQIYRASESHHWLAKYGRPLILAVSDGCTDRTIKAFANLATLYQQGVSAENFFKYFNPILRKLHREEIDVTLPTSTTDAKRMEAYINQIKQAKVLMEALNSYGTEFAAKLVARHGLKL